MFFLLRDLLASGSDPMISSARLLPLPEMDGVMLPPLLDPSPFLISKEDPLLPLLFSLAVAASTWKLFRRRFTILISSGMQQLFRAQRDVFREP